MDFFIIDFDEAAPDEVCLGSVVLGYGYDLLESAGNDSSCLLRLISAHHGVGFAATRLSVSEDGPVVAIQHVVY